MSVHVQYAMNIIYIGILLILQLDRWSETALNRASLPPTHTLQHTVRET